MQERLVPVLASSAHKGRCRDCRRRVIFVTTGSTPKRPSRGMAFDPPQPFPTRTEFNESTGLRFEYWPTATRHIYSCPSRRRTETPSAGTRGRRW